MKLTIEVEIDEELVATLARNAANEAFAPPESYGRRNAGFAYLAIEKATREAIAKIDFAPFILAEIERRKSTAVQEFVKEEVGKAIKRQIKEMTDAGKLFK